MALAEPDSATKGRLLLAKALNRTAVRDASPTAGPTPGLWPWSFSISQTRLS